MPKRAEVRSGDQRKRHPDVRRVRLADGKSQASGHYANDFVDLAIEGDVLSEEVGVRAEILTPDCITENNHVFMTGLIVGVH